MNKIEKQQGVLMYGRYLSRSVFGAVVFSVGISTGCAITDPPRRVAESDATKIGETARVRNKPSETVATVETSTDTSTKVESDQKEAQPETNETKEMPASNRSQSDVDRGDLEGWQHRVRGIELISAGDWELAARHLEWAAQLERNPKLANMLLEQLSADPEEYLGVDSFSYQVKPGDKLAAIAERFLGDGLKFPILARYNDIAVPQAMVKNTVLRIPRDAEDKQTKNPAGAPTVKTDKLDSASPESGAAPKSEKSDGTTEPTQTGNGIATGDTTKDPAADGGSKAIESTKSLFSRAEYHYRLGEFEQAQLLVDQILDIDSDNIRARLMKGRLQERLK